MTAQATAFASSTVFTSPTPDRSDRPALASSPSPLYSPASASRQHLRFSRLNPFSRVLTRTGRGLLSPSKTLPNSLATGRSLRPSYLQLFTPSLLVSEVPIRRNRSRVCALWPFFFYLDWVVSYFFVGRRFILGNGLKSWPLEFTVGGCVGEM